MAHNFVMHLHNPAHTYLKKFYTVYTTKNTNKQLAQIVLFGEHLLAEHLLADFE